MQQARRHDDDLEPSGINPAWIREGSPQARASKWGSSADGLVGTYVWSCTAGTFDWHFGDDEIVHVVEGSVTVTSPEGVTSTLTAGDSAFFPAGTVWLWHVPSYVRKHAVLVKPLPGPVRNGLAAARKAKQGATKVGVRGRGGMVGVAAAGTAVTGAATWALVDGSSLAGALGF